jgi:H+/Cl- antiporter ClcA
LLGVPIAAAAYSFLTLVVFLQQWFYADLPKVIGYPAPPIWWPLPVLLISGVLVAIAIRYLPGHGGAPPHVDGFKAGEALLPKQLPGVALAALASLGLGVVLGPEAPLIALGGGLAIGAIRLLKRNLPAQATAVVAAAGSFAAISTLLGSPILGTFLLMEASGLGGAELPVVLLPGLVASGVGALIFVGLNNLTGLGTFSLAIPSLPTYAHPTVAQFAWAPIIGLTGALVGAAIRRSTVFVRSHVVEQRLHLATPLAGVVIALLAIVYAIVTGRGSTEVLFSGQAGLGPLIADSASYSIAALLLLMACKSLAYVASLSSFRGGPIFPAMFLGGVAGIAFSHLPGLALVPAVAMGIGAMSAAMLQLPLTSVLLATLLIEPDGAATMPLVIVAVAVAFVASVWLTRPKHPPVAKTSAEI